MWCSACCRWAQRLSILAAVSKSYILARRNFSYRVIPVITWTLEKNKPVLLYDQANSSPTAIYKESTPRRLPASNPNPPLMQKKPRRRWRWLSNPKYLQLPLVLDLRSVTPQLTDASPALGCCLCAVPFSPASLTRQHNRLQSAPPARPASFIQ